MAVKISDLVATTDFDFDDIFHLRTAGGIDKKITGANLRKDLGQIAPFIRKVVTGWIYCDGSTIDKTANPEYEELVDMLKAEAGADAAHPYYAVAANEAVLPNLQGAGIRGIDDAATRDMDGTRKSGDYQEDKHENHTHTTDIGAHDHALRYSNVTGPGSGYLDDVSENANYNADAENSVVSENIGNKISGNPSAGGAVETVGKNIALYYLIRY